MVKLRKRASKRVSTTQREKVKRKVREHHRKARKEAKTSTQWKSRTPKDPGIPNSYPYKEQLLEEIQQRREAAKEAKLASKSKAAVQKPEDDGEDDEASIRLEAPAAQTAVRQKNRPEYPGSLASMLEDQKCRAIILAADARDPSNWLSPWLQQQCAAKDKVFAVVLTRADLVPSEAASAWAAEIGRDSSASVFVTGSEAGKGSLGGISKVSEHLSKSAIASDQIVVVCGFENSGRTTLASALQSAFGGAGAPSVFDSAHLIPAEAASSQETASNDLLMRNKGALQRIKEPLPLVTACISRVKSVAELQVLYGLPAFASAVGSGAAPASVVGSFLLELARKTGRLKKGDLPDEIAAARVFLRDWSSGNIKYYARPSGQQPGKASLSSVLGFASLPRREWRKTWGRQELQLNPSEASAVHREEVMFAAAKTQSDARGRHVRIALPSEQDSDVDGSDGAAYEEEGDEEDEYEDQEEAGEGEEEEEADDDIEPAPAKPKAAPGAKYVLSDFY